MPMRVIWKFQIHLRDVANVVVVPDAAKTRHVGLDPNTGLLSAWIELDPQQVMRSREFHVHGTGHPIEFTGEIPDKVFVGTVFDGPFVWHVYEKVAF